MQATPQIKNWLGCKFHSIEELNENLVAIKARTVLFRPEKAKHQLEAAPILSIEEWTAQLELAVAECADSMRQGDLIDWSKYRFCGTRKSVIWKRAKAIVRSEDEAATLLGPAFQMSRIGAYRYLMFLCLLLGLLSGKPLVAFREESHRLTIET